MRTVVTVGSVVAVLLVAGCGKQDEKVDLAAIPTATSSATATVCGGLPRRAVELAVGSTKLRVSKHGAGLDKIRSTDVTTCQVYASGADKWSLDVAYADFKSTENQQLLAEFEQAGGGTREKRLPTDLGTGLVDSPWSSQSPSAQVTMMDGAKQLQITLARAPAARNQRQDVLAIARLLKGYFG